MTEAQIEVLFQQLLGLGCRPPKALESAQGMAFAVKTWAEVLADIDPRSMQGAVMRYARSRESRFWPTPGVLVELIQDLQQAPDDQAGEQWGRLLRLASARGRSNPPGERWRLHDDPDIDAKMTAGLEAVGGWIALCNSTASQHTAHRAAFRQAYEAKTKAQQTQQERKAIGALIERRLGRLIDKGKKP